MDSISNKFMPNAIAAYEINEKEKDKEL